MTPSAGPIIALPGGPVGYTEMDPLIAIDGAATLSDPDSANFDTGVLTVDFGAGGTANDRLSILDQGPGAGNIAVSGSDVTYDFGAGPIVIGTFAELENTALNQPTIANLPNVYSGWEEAKGAGSVLDVDAASAIEAMAPLNEQLANEVYGPGTWDAIQAAAG